MENLPDSMDFRPRKSRTGLWIFAILVIVLLASAVTYLLSDKIANVIEPEMVNQRQITDSNIVETVPTIQEVLNTRDYIKECQRIDSVFLTMPDIILIDILLQHGTSLSNTDIVTIYESNKERYNNVMSGARVQQYKDSLNKYNNTKDTAFVQRE